jgi:hypothetical protein
MKIIASARIRSGDLSLYKRDPILGEYGIDWDKNEFWWEIDSCSPILDRVCELSHQVNGVKFHVRTEFTKKEFDSVELFQLRAASEGLADTAADQDAYRNYIHQLEYHRCIPDTGIRIMDKYYLSRVRVKPDANSIYSALGSYIASRGACEIMERENISGLRFGPVCHPKTEIPHDSVRVLIPANIMPPCKKDQSVCMCSTPTDGMNSYGLCGSISYSKESTEAAQDYNCMCEPIGAWNFGLIIVRKRLMEIFKSHKIKGARFQPVLDTSTPLYAKYHAEHQRLLEKIQSNPMNKW